MQQISSSSAAISPFLDFVDRPNETGAEADREQNERKGLFTVLHNGHGIRALGIGLVGKGVNAWGRPFAIVRSASAITAIVKAFMAFYSIVQS